METISALRNGVSQRVADYRLVERHDAFKARVAELAAQVPDPATLPVLRRAPRITTFVVALVVAVAIYAAASGIAGALYSMPGTDAAPIFEV